MHWNISLPDKRLENFLDRERTASPDPTPFNSQTSKWHHAYKCIPASKITATPMQFTTSQPRTWWSMEGTLHRTIQWPPLQMPSDYSLQRVHAHTPCHWLMNFHREFYHGDGAAFDHPCFSRLITYTTYTAT